jgi:hypothetical protein
MSALTAELLALSLRLGFFQRIPEIDKLTAHMLSRKWLCLFSSWRGAFEREEGIEPSSPVWKTGVIAFIRLPH